MVEKDEDPVINLFFQGTKLNRAKDQNLMTSFFEYTRVDENNFKRLFDGPGCPSFPESPAPGQYKYDPKATDPKDEKKPLHSKDREQLKKFYATMQRLTGVVAGNGVEDNILEALMYIEKILQESKKRPQRINLYGYSRGADTAVRLSHLLYVFYPDIEINIFALDDVPGPGQKAAHETRVIPRNVNNFTNIYMLDENLPVLEPEDPNRLTIMDPNKTKMTTHFLRGKHGYGNCAYGRKTDVTAKIAHDYAYEFALENGTNLKGIPPIIQKDPNGRYQKIIAKRPEGISEIQSRRLGYYQEMKDLEWVYNKLLLRGISPREFVSRKGNFVRDADYFVTQEHRELFKKFYPAVFDRLFQGGVEAYTVNSIIKDINEMRIRHPAIFESLKPFGFEFKEGKYLLPEARGIPVIEESPILNKMPIIHNELSYLKFALTGAINYLKYNPMFSAAADADMLRFSRKYLETALQKILDSNKSDDEKCKIIYKLVLREIALFKRSDVSHAFVHLLEGILDNYKVMSEISNMLINKEFKNFSPEVQKTIGNYQKQIQTYSNDQSLPESEKTREIQSTLVKMHNNIISIKKGLPEGKEKDALGRLNNDIKFYVTSQSFKHQYADKVKNLLDDQLFRSNIKIPVLKVLSYFGIKTNIKFEHIMSDLAKSFRDFCDAYKKQGKGNDYRTMHDLVDKLLIDIRITRRDYDIKNKTDLEKDLEKVQREIALLSRPSTLEVSPQAHP